MDPDANWKELSETACSDDLDDLDRCQELASALDQWLLGGGFPPKITGNQKFDKLVAEATCHLLLQR